MGGAYFPLVNQLYETQFYGFPPSDYTDEIYDIISQSIEESLLEFDEYFKKSFAKSFNISEKNFINKVDEAISIGIENLEHYLMSNILCIPEHILLPEDAGNRHESITHEHVDKKMAELAAHKLKLKKIHEFNKKISNIEAEMWLKIRILKNSPLPDIEQVAGDLVQTASEAHKQKVKTESLLKIMKEISEY